MVAGRTAQDAGAGRLTATPDPAIGAMPLRTIPRSPFTGSVPKFTVPAAGGGLCRRRLAGLTRVPADAQLLKLNLFDLFDSEPDSLFATLATINTLANTLANKRAKQTGKHRLAFRKGSGSNVAVSVQSLRGGSVVAGGGACSLPAVWDV